MTVRDMFAGPPPEMMTSYYTSLSPFWHPVLRVEDLPADQPTAVKLLAQDIVLVKLDEEIVAMQNLCPHFQARLSDGMVDSLQDNTPVLRCPYHGWAYNRQGTCVEVPALPQGCTASIRKVPTYPVTIKYGLIWVCLGGEARFPLPDFPECEVPGMESTNIYVESCNTSVVRLILNFLDNAHAAWVHTGVLRDRSNPLVPELKITQTGNDLVWKYTVFQPPHLVNAVSNQTAQPTRADYTMIASIPNLARMIKHREDGGTYVVCLFPSPESCDRTNLFWRVVRNYNLGVEGEQQIVEMEEVIHRQDMPFASSQRPWLWHPTPVKGVDDYLVAYMKRLHELGIPTRI